jgi:hypothetical protein
MFLVARPNHGSIEERHTRHERRYSAAFDLPSVARKKLSIGFDGGQLSSDGGVLLLRGVEKKLGLAARLAACLRDRRKPERIEHPLEEMLRLRMFAIAAGYEDADDCDSLRYDPIFKMAVGHAPESGDPRHFSTPTNRSTSSPRAAVPRSRSSPPHQTAAELLRYDFADALALLIKTERSTVASAMVSCAP